MLRNRPTIEATTKPFALSLPAINSQYFIRGIRPELAMQRSATILEIKPSRGGWRCFKAVGRRAVLDGLPQCRTFSVIQRHAQKLNTQRFACSRKTAPWRTAFRFDATDSRS